MGPVTRSMSGGCDDFVRVSYMLVDDVKSEVSHSNRLKKIHVLYRWLLRHPQWLRTRRMRIFVDVLYYKLDEFVIDGMSSREADRYRRSIRSFF